MCCFNNLKRLTQQASLNLEQFVSDLEKARFKIQIKGLGPYDPWLLIYHVFAEAIRLPMNFDQELPTHQAPHANIQCFHGGDEAEKDFAARGKELEALKGILQNKR